VDEYVNSADLEKFRQAYEEQAKRGDPSAIVTFNYAHALIRSSKDNVRTGIFLLEGLLKRDIDGAKRDYVYYLAVANTRIKEYDRALSYLDVLLTAESDNRQAIALKELVNERMKKG
jgi:fission 1 protein